MSRIPPRLAAKGPEPRTGKARARTSRKPRQDPAPAKSPNPADWLGPLRRTVQHLEAPAAQADPDPAPADWLGPLRFLATE